jgi:hypothetical protein
MAKRGRVKKDKDPYEGLNPEFKVAVEQGTDEEIRAKLAEVALDQQRLLDLQDKDTDYKQKKEALKIAGELYRDGKKQHKLKVKFAMRVLQSRGRDVD